MNSGTLLSFLALDLLLVCVPGADWAYVIANGVRGRSVGRAVAGLVAGYALHTTTFTEDGRSAGRTSWSRARRRS